MRRSSSVATALALQRLNDDGHSPSYDGSIFFSLRLVDHDKLFTGSGGSASPGFAGGRGLTGGVAGKYDTAFVLRGHAVTLSDTATTY